jgi:hypothetical protein
MIAIPCFREVIFLPEPDLSVPSLNLLSTLFHGMAASQVCSDFLRERLGKFDPTDHQVARIAEHSANFPRLMAMVDIHFSAFRSAQGTTIPFQPFRFLFGETITPIIIVCVSQTALRNFDRVMFQDSMIVASPVAPGCRSPFVRLSISRSCRVKHDLRREPLPAVSTPLRAPGFVVG